ncbi:MAG: amidohydrolase family protein [Myxococcota bacterium]
MWWMAVAAADVLVLESVRLVDADGERTAEVLVIDGDRIAYIGDDTGEWPDAERHALAGKTVIPGLVDAHVHLSMAPGAAFVERTDAEEEARWAWHLRAFVACGVTAVLDTGITPRNAERLLALDGPRPEIRLLGPLVSPEGGYVSAVIPEFPGTPDPATLARQLEEFDRFDPIGVKVTMEDGVLKPIWPLHTPEVRAALNAQPRPLFVHAMTGALAHEALDTLDVDAFVHTPDGVEGLAPRMRSQEIPVVSTVSVYDAMLNPGDTGRMNDPLAKLVVPADEREALLDKRRIRASNREILRGVAPGLPGFLRRPVAGLLASRKPIQKRVDRVGSGLLELHRAGVHVVLGSDSGNWPVFLGFLHGLTTIREAEVLQEQGFTPAEILTIATLEGARLLGLEDELGTLEVGKRASLVVLAADPLADIGALRTAEWVVHDGRMATPAEWMAEP